MNDPSPNGDPSEVPVESVVPPTTSSLSSNEASIIGRFLEDSCVLSSTDGAMPVTDVCGDVRGPIALR